MWKSEVGPVLVFHCVAERRDVVVLSVSRPQGCDTDSDPKFGLLSLALPGKGTSSTIGVILG